MFDFIFKAVSDNVLYRSTDICSLGSVNPAEDSPLNHINKSFVFSSPNIDSRIVNLGVHFENADDDADYMKMLKLIGSEYPNQYGLYVEQTYSITGSVTNDLSGAAPSLNIVDERPNAVYRSGNDFSFDLNYNIDTATFVVILDSVNSVTWTEGPTGTLTPSGLPGVSGTIVGQTVTLTYTAPYTIVSAAAITSTYDTDYIVGITDAGREELENIYIVQQTTNTTTTTATITFVDENKVAKTNSRIVTSYDPNYKKIIFASGLVDLLAAPYEPIVGDRYIISGTSTRFISYDQGISDTNKILIASKSATLQSPNDKTSIKFGIKLPPNLFLSQQKEVNKLFNIKPVLTYSLED